MRDDVCGMRKKREPPRQQKQLPPLLRKEGSFGVRNPLTTNDEQLTTNN